MCWSSEMKGVKPEEMVNRYDSIGAPLEHWKLNESTGTVAENSAGDTNGSLVNMNGDEWTTGQLEGALEFDGDNDYINCHMKGWCAKISEGKTKLELMNNNSDEEEGFVVDNDKEEIPFA